MNSRIRLRMGDIEVEYEGSEDFIKSELLTLVSQVATLYRESDIGARPMGLAPAAEETLPPASGVSLSTSTIASRLTSETGPDLTIAAAAHLTLVKGLSSFTRQQLLGEMRSATAYYETSYWTNLTSYLGRLVESGHLVQSAKDTYALSADKKQELESTLAS